MGAFPLTLKPVSAESFPDADSDEFAALIDSYVAAATELIESLPEWKKGNKYNNGSTQTYTISSAATKKLGAKDHWAARESVHEAKAGSKPTKTKANGAAVPKANGSASTSTSADLTAPIQEPVPATTHHPVPPSEEFAEVKTAPGPPVGEFHAEPGPLPGHEETSGAHTPPTPVTHSEHAKHPNHPKPHRGLSGPGDLVRSVSRRFSRKASHPAPEPEPAHESAVASEDQDEIEKQEEVMTTPPAGIYERFRRGLLEYHSENEREYIESMRETKCLQVFKSHVAEVWKATYVVPRPASPRTFVFLLISREIKEEPTGERVFMNVSIPVTHNNLPEKQGEEAGNCRGCYVSVERVREIEGGKKIEWRMATASHAGGNIPMWVSSNQMPAKISEDVPAFIDFLDKKFPQ